VIGHNFYFGKNRAGSPDFFTAEAARAGFTLDIVDQLEDGGRPVSSGQIRAAIEAGRMADAAELLGFPWLATGTVIHGDHRGRELGFPTANLRLDPGCRLRHGIYAVRVGRGAQRLDGVASFGRRPTFDDGAPLLEVFLFDFTGDLYGATLDVAFLGWIREELRFANVADLVRQMNDDSRKARELLARLPDLFPPLGEIAE
jgi:riboflavin kinase/FMN adenylyltransferase